MIAPSKEAQRKPQPKRMPIRAIMFAVAGLATVGLFVYTVSSSRAIDEDEGKTAKKQSTIAELKPIKVPLQTTEEIVVGERPRSNVPPEQQVMHTNQYGYVINRPHTAVVITNKMDEADKPLEERIFDNSADQKIAGLLLLEPGEMLIGDASSLFGKGFTRAFLKSLEVPIIATKDDDEVVAELKRAVRDTKIELKARYDAGEDIAALMLKEREELQALGLYREELKNEIRKLARDKEIGEEDMEDFVKAANIMLEERGGKPLEMPRFAARRFRLDRIRRDMSNED